MAFVLVLCPIPAAFQYQVLSERFAHADCHDLQEFMIQGGDFLKVCSQACSAARS